MNPSIELQKPVFLIVNISGINCFNPAFDVTPAELITGGIITEFGVFPPHKLDDELKQKLSL